MGSFKRPPDNLARMVRIEPPKERRCERCGRVETWDKEAGTWVAHAADRGEAHCVHIWDITGSYNPIGNAS
jgi:hypothetical protein